MELQTVTRTASYAAKQAGGRLQPFAIERRAVGPRDVQIEIEYCGVCHTDIHFVNNDFGLSSYPLVPGHEIIGRVDAVGVPSTISSPASASASAAWSTAAGTATPARRTSSSTAPTAGP